MTRLNILLMFLESKVHVSLMAAGIALAEIRTLMEQLAESGTLGQGWRDVPQPWIGGLALWRRMPSQVPISFSTDTSMMTENRC